MVISCRQDEGEECVGGLQLMQTAGKRHREENQKSDARLSDILGSLLEKLLQFVIEIVYECERDEGSGMLWELCELLISSLLFGIRADVSSPVEGMMAETTRSQEVRREMLEMMKEFERKQELWHRESEEKAVKSFADLKSLIGGLSLQNQEYFFEVDRTPPEARVRLAALHLEGKAIQWHQGYIKTRGNEAYLDLSEYVIALNARFGQHVFYDPIADLRNLRQIGSLQSYMDEFDELYPRADIKESHALSFFLSGLIDELQMPVRMFKPQTLADAYSLARLQEIAVAALQNKPKPVSKGPSLYSPTTNHYHKATPITSISQNATNLSNTTFSKTTNAGLLPLPPSTNIPKTNPGITTRNHQNFSNRDLDERRAKGLCFWCDEKFTPGHKCKRKQLYVMQIQVETDGEGPEGNLQMEGLDEEDEQIQLSLNALMSNEDSQTMTLNGNYKGRSLFVLIDSGSSHNFLSSKVAKRVDCCWQKARGIRVTVANGQELHCTALCSDFRWRMQGQEFITEVYVLPLETYDLILGTQWLATLGDISWNFNTLQMGFELNGKPYLLQGKNKLQEKMSPWADKLKSLVEQPGLFAIQDLSDATLWAIQAFADVFEEPTGLPPVQDYDHQIDLKDEAGPINCRPYRYAAVQKDAIEKLIGEMLHAGDKFPIPVIEELLEELGGSTIFSKIDLRSGYWQIRMHEPDVPKTAFKTHEGHYEFLVMPFGLTNAPSTFQSLMNNIFQPYLRKFILVFFDDILIYSRSFSDHIHHLSIALQVLRENLLYAKSNKCFFGHSSIEYLGHVISSGGVYTDPQKVAAVRDWPTPITLKQLRGFLGLTGYYRRFVKDYGKIAKPLTDLLKKDIFHWTEGSNQAFMALKQAMITAPVLALPNFSKEFIIETDASGQGIGAVLMQEGHPIAYISKALSDRFQTLSTYEKEMLAILMAIKKWESYLVDRHFVIKTDHQSLKYLLEQRVTTPTQQAWVAKLMQYDYEISYKQGKENVAADALSRIQPAELFVLSTTILNTQLYDLIKESWGVDPELQKIIKAKEADPSAYPKYSWRGEELRRKGKLVVGVNEQLRREILNSFHDSPTGGHSGVYVTTKRISAIVYWKEGVFTDITMDFIEGLPKSNGKTAIFVVVDRLTKYGHFMLLPHPYTAKMVAQVFLDSVYKLHGLPHSITCDRDPIFTSVFWQEFFKLQGVSLQLSTAYHPQTDGQTEVVNRCIETYLRCMVGDNPGQWANWISLAEFWYNTSYHSSLKMSPFEALYGYAPPLQIPYFPKDSNVEAIDRVLNERESWLQLLKHHLSKAQQRMKIQADKNRFDREFNIGDMVLLKLQAYKQVSMHSGGPKLQPRYYGPFKVIDRIGTVAYQLQLPPDAQIHNVFHVSLLKPAHASIQACSSLPISNTSTTLLPQAILDRRLVKRHNVPAVQLLIHWVDKSPTDASWEFADDLKRRFPAFFLEDKEVS
ncbi:Transposon Ty3-I Gag-Pol polyprotein [Vitis vinifera]|uniref:RNA-directed DNA polymerase n=1 Tax=Vitis vinifera TaxID=29760 RepID=A0A438GHK7_VITVI|nr:Transposon Ty3-I Gag-Pol polyprotein [Vitis vinifera]